MVKKYYKAFAKNDKGEDIFYPWRYPGEALILNDELKKPFVSIYKFLFIGSITTFTFACFINALGIINLTELGYSYGVIINVYFLSYVGFVSYFRRKTRLYTVKKELRPRKILILAWFFVYVQLASLAIIYTDFDLSNFLTLLFFLLMSASTIFTLYVLYLIIKTRGYLLEGGTFLSP